MHRVSAIASAGLVAVATRFAVAGFGLLLFAAIPPRVAASSPLTDLGSSQNPSSACTTVTFTATVYGIIPPPLGGVIFFDGAHALGAEALSPDWGDELGVPVPTNHSSATHSAVLGAGTHIITFAYDSDAGAGLSDPLVQHVTAAASTTEVTSSVDPSVYGEQVTWLADISNPCSASVTGTVQFRADGTDIGGPQQVDGGGHASFTTLTCRSASTRSRPSSRAPIPTFRGASGRCSRPWSCRVSASTPPRRRQPSRRLRTPPSPVPP